MANLAARTRRVDPSTASPTIELWPQNPVYSRDYPPARYLEQ
jgi:hypothetical protein